MLIYHLGVVSRLRSAGIDADLRCFAGSSGGAIAAAAAACIADIDRFAEFAVRRQSRLGLQEMLPSDDEINRLTAGGRLAVSVTDCSSGENVLVRQFTSKTALVQAINASCLIPRSFHPLDFFSMKRSLRQTARSTFHADEGLRLAPWHPSLQSSYVDGGLSANVPAVPDHETLRVSVLACPEERLLIANNHLSALRLPGFVYMTGLRILLSTSNLRAGVAAVAGSEAELRHFYERGSIDCESYLRVASESAS
jgi:predicted acylesterase/phospholipase RssA